MSMPLHARLSEFSLLALAGAAIALSAAFTTAVTAAIATPSWFLDAFGSPTAIFGGPSLLGIHRSWWGHGLELSLPLSVALAWRVAHATRAADSHPQG